MSYKNRNRQPRTSFGVTALAAAAFLAFGPALAPAQGNGPDGRLFVDRDRGRLGGACTSIDPCARITDALTLARGMRYGLDPSIPKLPPNMRINISVRASVTPYLGSPDPARLAADPTLEALPLFLNISRLDLAGESKFPKDADGWIPENPIVANATTIKSEAPLPGFLALIFVGISAGMSADDVSVQGLVLDGNTPPFGAGFLVMADRAQGFLVRETYQIHATYGVGAQGSSGTVEQCLMTHLGEGVLVFGGNSTNWPSEVTVRNTRSVEKRLRRTGVLR